MPRYFVRFPKESMRMEAHPMLGMDADKFQPFLPTATADAARILIADLSDEERNAAVQNGAEIFEDVQFHPVSRSFDFWSPKWQYSTGGGAAMPMLAPAPAPWATMSLRDVLNQINAPTAWQRGRGGGVTIGIVDTGIASTMLEFPTTKQSPSSKSFTYASPWADNVGHGSMCGCIAAATSSHGGKYDGVAPEATLMSLRSTLASTDIYKLYDWTLTQKRSGAIQGPIVMSNSYGLYTCSAPPGLPANHPYRQIILDAISDGITVVFAAGNNHADVLCNNDPTQCSPNTIWAVNSMDEVLSIGTVNWDERLDVGAHANSSRGPGQWALNHPKPDCVAPTYGDVVWGAGYKTMEWWGTSGACPQVAGLAALLLSVDPQLSPAQIANIIRSSCRSLPLGPSCSGAGIIDCQRAVAALP